jgi:hypothetical protein
MKQFARLSLVVALALAGCGGGDGGGLPSNQLPGDDPGPVHVHGLGINPADGALFIATHSGLYRAAPGEERATRVGDNLQDTMGFTIAGPDHFLGSGHPEVRQIIEENVPPNLGLIESRDGGQTWTPISLRGEADFHVLRVADDRVYGFDASNTRLLVSEDSGQTWEERDTPALLDLVPDPTDAKRIVAASEVGLLESGDAGRTWRPLSVRDTPPAGFLAWPDRSNLFLVDADGRLWLSTDSGVSWQPRGRVGGQPAALTAITQEELYVALHDGTVKRSTDGGGSWAVRSRP